MRVTQGTFSFLPDFTDEQIKAQVDYAMGNGWAVGVEYTDDPHPRNTYWEMWGPPMFDEEESDAVMVAMNECREANPNHYIRVVAFDSTRGWETPRLSFIVNRPEVEPGFRLVRQEAQGRTVRYTVESYAVVRDPQGERYRNGKGEV